MQRRSTLSRSLARHQYALNTISVFFSFLLTLFTNFLYVRHNDDAYTHLLRHRSFRITGLDYFARRLRSWNRCLRAFRLVSRFPLCVPTSLLINPYLARPFTLAAASLATI